MLATLLLAATAASEPTYDVVLVPGCPSRPDGTLSTCQWRRAHWAAELYDRGQAEHFITSGSAVYTPYVEAEALAEAMVTLGVPREAITLESRALHSDENALYALEIAAERGASKLAVASDGTHARTIERMGRHWGVDLEAVPLDNDLVMGRVLSGVPRVSTPEVPDWQPLEEREDRPSSFVVYARMALGLDTEGALDLEVPSSLIR